MDIDYWNQSEIAIVHHPSTPAEWRSALQPYFGLNNLPVNRCLEVVLANNARTLVVERRYYDLDYRSEYSVYFSRLHVEVPPSTHRLHFFGAHITLDQVGRLPSNPDYIGYMVMRPTVQAPVSRAMLRPPPEIEAAIRTKVEEHVSFFGDTLAVKGFPFTQQDTQLCVCAHAAAWVCHYAAHLRGDVARVPRAEFATQANASLNSSRMMPSSGLTVAQLSDLFRTFDLPAVFYALGDLPDERLPWQPPAPQQPPPNPSGQISPARTWDYGVVSILCRYLNSGLPILVGTHDHAFVICGYRRSPSQPGWIDFYRNDDQQGPYIFIQDVLHDSGQTPWRTLHIPVSGRLWLSPEAAELYGGRVLERTSDAIVAAVSGMYGVPVESLSQLIMADRLALKTYGIKSNHFKRDLLARGIPDDFSARLQNVFYVSLRDCCRSSRPRSPENKSALCHRPSSLRFHISR